MKVSNRYLKLRIVQIETIFKNVSVKNVNVCREK